ncbi:hypothetical protein R5R35_006555 [Gryllus longicercus]|uniref:Uncharacterized protein n=1 Tax=Gryllus longicercus TaxID=2509291 RepID=A0AAN9V520_9ORTH
MRSTKSAEEVARRSGYWQGSVIEGCAAIALAIKTVIGYLLEEYFSSDSLSAPPSATESISWKVQTVYWSLKNCL